MPDAFTDLVREMRTAQSYWYHSHKPSALIAAKELERKVDAALKAIDEAEQAKVEARQAAMDFDVI